MQATYYYCPDSENVYATVAGSRGIFRLFAAHRHTGPWDFLAPDTEAWDYTHQKLFRRHAVETLDPGRLEAPLPPLPPAPPGPFPTWAERQGGGRKLPRQAYPRLTARVAAAGGRLPVYVVLREDRYESMFGDGRFLDFYAAFLSEEAAEACVAAVAGSRDEARSLVRFTLEAAADGLGAPDFAPRTFERYPLAGVVASLEATLP